MPKTRIEKLEQLLPDLTRHNKKKINRMVANNPQIQQAIEIYQARAREEFIAKKPTYEEINFSSFVTGDTISLCLTFNYPDEAIHHTKALLQFLTENPSITQLTLPGINDEIATLLASNQTLQSLDSRFGAITSLGAEALAKNTIWTKLILENNNISDRGALAFAKNTSLKELDIGGKNPIRDESALIELALNFHLEVLILPYLGRYSEETQNTLARIKSGAFFHDVLQQLHNEKLEAQYLICYSSAEEPWPHNQEALQQKQSTEIAAENNNAEIAAAPNRPSSPSTSDNSDEDNDQSEPPSPSTVCFFKPVVEQPILDPQPKNFELEHKDMSDYQTTT
jgi:hypothetical protein